MCPRHHPLHEHLVLVLPIRYQTASVARVHPAIASLSLSLTGLRVPCTRTLKAEWDPSIACSYCTTFCGQAPESLPMGLHVGQLFITAVCRVTRSWRACGGMRYFIATYTLSVRTLRVPDERRGLASGPALDL